MNCEYIKLNKQQLSLVLKPIRSERISSLDIIRNAISNRIATLFFSLELSDVEIEEKLEVDKEILKESKIILSNTKYIENICQRATRLKQKANIELIIIDSIIDLSSKRDYFLGRANIVSILIRELKELAIELDVEIIVTAPTYPNVADLMNDKNKLLSFFCKASEAKEFVDNIYIIE